MKVFPANLRGYSRVALLLFAICALFGASEANAAAGTLPIVRGVERPVAGKPDDPGEGVVYLSPEVTQPRLQALRTQGDEYGWIYSINQIIAKWAGWRIVP